MFWPQSYSQEEKETNKMRTLQEFRNLAVAIVILLIGNSTIGQEQKEIPLPPQFVKGTLENGLTYYIRKNKEPEDHAELYLIEKAGSLQENKDQLGLAHFTEHMAFNGTKSFPKNELIDYLEEAGIRFGADLNAYTSFSETVFLLPIPTDKPDIFKSGFKILSEWAAGINFDNDEIDAERGVILEEERQRGKNMSERMRKKILPIYLKDSRYLDRIPIGTPEVINNFKYDTLKDFYNEWYRPGLQGVVAVGDFDVKKVESYIKKYFGSLKNKKDAKAPKQYSIPENEEVLAKVATDPEFPYTILSVTVKHPKKTVKNDQDFYNSVVKSAALNMLSSRIGELIRNGETSMQNAGVGYGSYQGGLGNLDAFTLQMIPKKPELIENGIKQLMDELHKVQEYGFTQTELDRVKKNYMNTVEKSYKERNKTSSKVYANQAEQNFLKGKAIIGSKYSLKFYEKNLPKISINDVNKVAQNLFGKKNQIIVLQAPEKLKEKLPTKKELIQWVNSERDVVAYQDKVSNQPLLDDILKSSKIKSKKKIKSVGVEQYKLKNGVKIILKNTDFKNDQILFQGFSEGGISLSKKENILSNRLADGIIGASGLSDFDATQLGKMLSGKSLAVTPYIGLYNEGIKGSASPEDIETALQLVYLYFTKPRKDSTAFSRLIDNYKMAIKAKKSNPIAVFQDTINAVMRGKSDWTRGLELEDIDNISLDQSLRFYKERFSNAGDFTFIFVGNFEQKTLLPLVEKYLGSLPSHVNKEKFRDLGIKPMEKNVQKTVFKGLEEKATVVMSFHGKFKYSPENNLELKALKSALETKLLKRLREKESGVYSPSVGLSYAKKPNQYYVISLSFSCDPARVKQLMAAANDEIRKLKANGPSVMALQKFKAKKEIQHKENIRKNGYWLRYQVGS